MNLSDRTINRIPADAHSLECFEVRGGEAFIGFKLPNDDFHYVQIPYTVPENRR